MEEGDVAIVVATAAHRRGVQKRLAEAGVDVLAAVENGTFRFLDADQTMRRFLLGGWPDAAEFESVIGGLLRQASQTGRPIRVFGEMVALLWEAGQVNAALELEALWNDLARQLPFSLFCAYPKQFMTGDDIDAFAQVCGLHTAVVPGAKSAHANAATITVSPPTTTPAQKPAALESGRAQARERILATADSLFSRRGVHKVGVDELISSSGVAKATFYRHFPSKDDLVLAFLGRSEQRWTRELIEAGAQRRGITPEQRLLAVFDVLNESFNHPDDFEGCTFINVLLEMGASHPLGQASIGYLDNLRGIARRWASEAGLREVDSFARSWHILITGSLISASEGDRCSASRARQMAQLLIEQHRPGSRQAPIQLPR
jgi:AcrR family transcriptional regulator